VLEHPIRWWIGAPLLVAAVVLPLLRQSGAHSWDTIWAEDGAIYANQALDHGAVSVLLRGYAGYLQLPPRLLALLVPAVPLRQLALYAAVAASIVNALLAWFVYRQSRGWITSPLLRVVLASSIVIGPAMLGENTTNITNTIWTFAAVAPWALGSLQDRPASIVARSSVAFLAATSTALSFIYLPLALLIVLTRRTRSSLIVTASFGAGLLLQGLVLLHTARSTAPFPNEVVFLVRAVGVRVFWYLLVGPTTTGSMRSSPTLTLALVSIVIVIALFVAASIGASRRARVAAALLFVTAVTIFAVPVWGRGTFFLQIAGPLSTTQFDERFSVIPIFLLLSGAMILLDDPFRRPRGWVRIARIALVAQILLLTALNFYGSTGRSYVIMKVHAPYPRWTHLVDAAWEKCDGERSDRVVQIPASFAFPVSVTCDELAP
jgi:hypothetical protein